MKAVLINKHGGPEVLEMGEVSTPKIGCKDVLVRVRACAMNHLDLWVRKGEIGIKLPFPHILGSDIAGTVEEIGKEVQGIEKNEKVLISPGLSCRKCLSCLSGKDNLCKEYKIIGEHTWGGYAQFIKVPEVNILPFPEDLSFEQGAAIPLTLLTAWQMAIKKANVQAGDTVLVMSAGSGVSVMLIQICKAFGAKVITSSSSEEKLDKALDLGADIGINYLKENLVNKVKDYTNGKGVDVVFDHTGRDFWESVIKSAKWGGKIVLCGATSGFRATSDLRHIYYRQLTILGSTMGSKSDLLQGLEWVRNGKIKPIIGKVFNIDEAKEAHQALEARTIFGKIVFTVNLM